MTKRGRSRAGEAFLAAVKNDPEATKAGIRGAQAVLLSSARDWSEAQPVLVAELAKLDAELVAAGFDPPKGDMKSWCEIARIAERDPSGMNLDDIRDWALAAAKRRDQLADAIAKRMTKPQPVTPTDARNQFCYERWQAGDTLKQIWVAVNRDPEWEHYSAPAGVRKAINKWAKLHGLPVRKGQPGKPKA
jgi:hypothetical protein